MLDQVGFAGDKTNIDWFNCPNADHPCSCSS